MKGMRREVDSNVKGRKREGKKWIAVRIHGENNAPYELKLHGRENDNRKRVGREIGRFRGLIRKPK